MGGTLEVVAPVFGLLLVGFAAVRMGWLAEASARGLVVFVFNFAIPALLFRSLATIEFPEQIEWGFLLSFYVGSLAVYGLGMAVARFVFGRSPDAQAIFGMAAGFSNTVMVGIPVLLMAFGPRASLPAFLLIALQSPLLLPLTVALIQKGRGGAGGLLTRLRNASGDLLRTPIITSVLAGLAVNVAGVSLPGPVDDLLALLGTAAVPCALFAMGASLATVPLRGDLAPASLLVGFKLLLHPLVVWILAVPLMGLEGIWVPVAVTMAAMPSGVNAYLFAARYEAAEGVASRAVFLSTALSVITISGVLYFFRGGV